MNTPIHRRYQMDQQDAPGAPGDPKTLSMTYRNYRGEVARRTIVPLGLRFGSTEWHKTPGWLLSAHDVDRDAMRDFALADCQFADLSTPQGDGLTQRVRESLLGIVNIILANPNSKSSGAETVLFAAASANTMNRAAPMEGERPRLVVLESPFAGNPARNTIYARRALHDSLKRGEAPIASHMLYTQEGVLDDNEPDQRQLGIDAGLSWLRVAQESVAYVDYGVSGGMLDGLLCAAAHGVKVTLRAIGENPGDYTTPTRAPGAPIEPAPTDLSAKSRAELEKMLEWEDRPGPHRDAIRNAIAAHAQLREGLMVEYAISDLRIANRKAAKANPTASKEPRPMTIHPMTVHPRLTNDEYSWTVELDDDAEAYFIVGPHGTVAMVHRDEDRDMLASAPALFYENQRLKAELAAMKEGVQ